jgi:hypothetical protein
MQDRRLQTIGHWTSPSKSEVLLSKKILLKNTKLASERIVRPFKLIPGVMKEEFEYIFK